MVWKENCVMDQRLKFIADYLEELYDMSELCSSYGISRKTGYKWVKRYDEYGVEGLKDQSRRPHQHPRTIDDWVREKIIQVKLAHQSFGPKKVMDYLRRNEPQHHWPVDSTAGEILKRAGLVKKRKRRSRVNADTEAFKDCDRPNRVWSTDFKGDFKLGNGQRCYPLTITDNNSRYLLHCRGLERTRERDVRPWFEWCFREYGMPDAMRSDNGPPFASLALGGISGLSKWWIKLGIKPERIKPGKPQQNGRHERMHRSLKEATISPSKYSIPAQQRAFDDYLNEYNIDRSHEGIERKTPSEVYYASSRCYPGKIPPIDYNDDYQVRTVRYNGEIKWQGHIYYVSQVLAKEPIGLIQVNESQWQIYFSFYLLGVFDEREGKILPNVQWHSKH